ncbi:hypothetical protein [Microbacterium sp. CH12i]|nr:hypothetical protein [Microbacterium sp. CH12i]
MTSALIALAEPRASMLRTSLERDGIRIVGIVAPSALTDDVLINADA